MIFPDYPVWHIPLSVWYSFCLSISLFLMEQQMHDFLRPCNLPLLYLTNLAVKIINKIRQSLFFMSLLHLMLYPCKYWVFVPNDQVS